MNNSPRIWKQAYKTSWISLSEKFVSIKRQWQKVMDHLISAIDGSIFRKCVSKPDVMMRNKWMSLLPFPVVVSLTERYLAISFIVLLTRVNFGKSFSFVPSKTISILFLWIYGVGCWWSSCVDGLIFSENFIVLHKT